VPGKRAGISDRIVDGRKGDMDDIVEALNKVQTNAEVLA
jgi:hypothetical protein